MAALRAPPGAERRAARGLRAADRLRGRRRRGHQRHELRARLRAGRDGHRAGRRDRHLRHEHPGLLGPLIAARHRGATVRAVPFAELAKRCPRDHDAGRRLARELDHRRGRAGGAGRGAGAGDPRRRAGRRRGAGRRQGARLRRLRRRRPEVAVRRRRHRDAAGSTPSSASGCGRSPGYGLRGRLAGPGIDAARGRAALRRPLSREAVAFSLAALRVLVAAGLDALMERAADLAERFATALADAGYTVAPRGRSTLVSFEYPDPTPRASGSRRPASPCATCPATRTCASRSAPGTTSPTSSGCSRRCEVRLRLLRIELRHGPRLARPRRSSPDARRRGSRVVYGGASVGLMGALADTALEAGGEVVGVIPQELVDREVAHPGLTELHVVARCTSARR